MSAKPGIREFLDWIAGNDDNEWIEDENGSPSVTASMVADCFGKSSLYVAEALARRTNRKLHPAVRRQLTEK